MDTSGRHLQQDWSRLQTPGDAHLTVEACTLQGKMHHAGSDLDRNAATAWGCTRAYERDSAFGVVEPDGVAEVLLTRPVLLARIATRGSR